VFARDGTHYNARACASYTYAHTVEIYFSLNGINLLLGLVRVMKFLRMNAYLGQLTDALEMMKEGLMQFIVVLVLVITTFTFIGMMLFGDQLKVFADPGMAVDTIMGYTIGSSDSSELYDVDATSFLILYVPFVFIMLFFVLPLTIAIIMDGYSEMQVCSCAVRESISFPVSVPVSAKVAESVCKHVSVSPQL